MRLEYDKACACVGIESSQRDGSSVQFADSDDERIRHMVALYNYDPEELSPNIDADVSLASLLQTLPSKLLTLANIFILLHENTCNASHLLLKILTNIYSVFILRLR